mmetsp:Transcript_19707/g.30425  ORF Transcript_19707/g.30425 Transcript_19707/m.30425 type:complete len:87 (+) Transcript_19707:47-307(+)
MKNDFMAGQDIGTKKIDEWYAAPEEMPHQTYNWILFRCFDSCVKDFDNKMIDKTEEDCVGSCANSLKDAPNLFFRHQMFKGFQEMK